MPQARIACQRVRDLVRQFPAVALLGPRQIGKSTLARLAYPKWPIFDLEDPVDLRRFEADPLLVLAENPRLIIDEVQRMPGLFPILRSWLDRHPSARVMVLGSAAPALVRGISESLTGRIGIFELGGILVSELEAERLWLLGGFPRVHWSRPRSTPEDWYPSYVRTCLEQDVPQLGFSVPAARLRTLLMMIASSQGGLCNLSSFGTALGVSYQTVGSALDILESLFLVRRLRPWFANLKKRLVKSPKLYIRDSGMLHHLAGIPFSREKVLSHLLAGASFESFCLEQIILHAQLADPSSEPWFFRTHDGLEIDLLLKAKGRLIPIEFKLGLGVPDLGSLTKSCSELGLDKAFVVYAGRDRVRLTETVTMLGLDRFIADELGVRRLRPKP